VADFDIDPDPVVDRAVEALAASPDGQSVFVAGTFGQLNGLAVDKLVKLDATTGALKAGFKVAVKSGVKDLAVSGNRLYLAGAFSSIGSQARGGLAAVDVTTGALDADVNIAFTDPFLGGLPGSRPSPSAPTAPRS
jgi:hypothetical protein